MTPFDLLSQQDGFNEECAVFGVYGSSEAHVLTALGLHALQHRGQEATGMVSFNGQNLTVIAAWDRLVKISMLGHPTLKP